MNKLWYTVVVVTGINLLLLAIAFTGYGIIISVIGLIVELIVGVVYACDKEKRKQGQGILLGLGLFILIGASVCGLILSNLSIGH